jgi:tetratricopeptide (TPR) repeat protein
MTIRGSVIGLFALAAVVCATQASGATSSSGDGAWQAYMDAAALADAEGRPEDAESSLLEALREAEEPGGARMHLAFSVEALAELYHRADRRDEAETFYLRSVSLWEELLGPEQPRIGIPIHNLAVLHLQDCRVDEALPLIARVVELWERTLGADHPDRVNAIRSEANGLRSCSRDEEAAELEGLLKPPAGSATANAAN